MIAMHVDARHLRQDWPAICDVRGRGGWYLLLNHLTIAHGFDDDVFDGGGRNARDRSERSGAGFAMEMRQRDIVAITDPGFGCMSWHHAIACIVE
jgi:hypothetical protein